MNITFKFHSIVAFIWVALQFISCGPRNGGENQIAETNPAKNSKTSANVNSIISPKLYLEHSGSMFAYDNPGTRGELKNSLISVLNNFDQLRPTSTDVYIVNDKVYPYSKTFKQLVISNSIFRRKIGNSDYTDFEEIFQQILNDTKSNEIGILFSDLIYSGKEIENQTSQRILDAAQQLTRRAFNGKAEKMSIGVIKLQSDYKGMYYPFSDSKIGVPYSGLRPYYICIFAENATMYRFLTEQAYGSIRDFAALPRYKNFIFFSKGSFISTPYYTVSEGDPLNNGRFSPSRERNEGSSAIHSIDNIVPPRTGQFNIAIAVSLPKWAFDQKYILDPGNYEVESMKDGFKIKRIEKLRQANSDGTTHKVVLQATNITSGQRQTIIKLKRMKLPKWVDSTHSADDRNTRSPGFASQTFGLKSILKGISDAYENSGSNDNYFFALKLTLN